LLQLIVSIAISITFNSSQDGDNYFDNCEKKGQFGGKICFGVIA
jgi:hypothetical protein